MEYKLEDILLRNKKTIICKTGSVDKKKKLIFFSELLSLGYEIENDHYYTDDVLKNEKYDFIINTLKKMKAGHVNYVPLFSNFPNDVPDDNEYFCKRIFGLFGNYLGLLTNGEKLNSGLVIPEWLFDIKEFGADPITQFQDLDLYNQGTQEQNNRKKDVTGTLFKIKLVSEKEGWEIGKSFLNEILTSKSSIKESLKKDIEFLLEIYNVTDIDVNNITFKETKSYLLKYFWIKQDYNSVYNLTSNSTDLLRLFASLTNTDISLTEKIKFPKFNNEQRKVILKTLDKFSNLEEDLNRYKNIWIAIAKGLHVGSYIKKYPNVVKVFNSIRNEKIVTWNSVVETNISNNSFTPEMINLLQQRPTEFARRIHKILRLAKSEQDTNKIITAFIGSVDKVSLKVLLVLEKYFKTINYCSNRTIFNKNGKIKIIENKLDKLEQSTIDRICKAINNSIISKIEKRKESWETKKVWIDPELVNYTVPLQQRKSSNGLLTVGRGSRIKFDTSKVLRLFLYWQQKDLRTDLDLSLVEFDNDMNYKGHVSYTRLSNTNIKHSGDIQSAPHGATEFIDITIPDLKKEGVRYISPQVHKFCGNNFSEMDECYVGWMCREKVDKNYKSFDIKTVENMFTLNGSSAYTIPMIIDLEKNEIIFTDLYVGTRILYSNVENSLNSLSTIVKEVSNMVNTKPNMFDLSYYNCLGRKAEIVNEKQLADITIGVKDCDYNSNDIEKILSKFLL